jgi:hypothetical protein
MEPIVPAGLPHAFDPESSQVFTRNRIFWIPREIAGMGYLKLKGKL